MLTSLIIYYPANGEVVKRKQGLCEERPCHDNNDYKTNY